MTSASPTIVAIETSSAWVIILAVSLVTLVATMLLRRVVRRPGGLASGILLSLPLSLPLIAAFVYARAVLPELAVLRPARSALEEPGKQLIHLVLFSDDRARVVVPYALSGSAGRWMLIVGISVSGFMLLRRLVGTIGVRRLIRRARPLDGASATRLAPVAERLAGEIGLKRTPEILLLPSGVQGAFAVGGRNGRIMISRELPELLSDTELEAILAHEMAHLESRDCRVVFIAGVLRDMVAWNPFAHVAFRKLTTDRELEADRRAAEVTGHPLAVASSLLKVCDLVGKPRRVGPHPAVAFFRRRGRIARRVRTLMALADGTVSMHTDGRLPYVMAACVAAVLGLQAGARVAAQDGHAFAIVLGTPDRSLEDRTPIPDAPGQQLDRSKEPRAGSTRVDRRLHRGWLHHDAIRQRDVDDWIQFMDRMALKNGIPREVLQWEGAQNWQAQPLLSRPRIGPIGLYRIETLQAI